MTDAALRSVVRQLRCIIGSRAAVSAAPDAELLKAFVDHGDESAIEMLILRHGKMVFNLCRRILHDEHHAEDAFQASFLILFRKARSISRTQSVSSWLCKVAFRVAQELRKALAKQRSEACNLDHIAGRGSTDDSIWRDLLPVLDEEIVRLPEKYRLSIVLYYLQGHTTEEVAGLLRCSPEAIRSRLSRGRRLLRSRLMRHGLVLPTGWLATELSVKTSSGAVPGALVFSTVKAAIEFATGNAVSGFAPESVATLAQRVLHAMFTAELTKAALVVVAVVALGAWAIANWALADSRTSRRGASQAAVDARGEDRFKMLDDFEAIIKLPDEATVGIQIVPPVTTVNSVPPLEVASDESYKFSNEPQKAEMFLATIKKVEGNKVTINKSTRVATVDDVTLIAAENVKVFKRQVKNGLTVANILEYDFTHLFDEIPVEGRLKNNIFATHVEARITTGPTNNITDIQVRPSTPYIWWKAILFNL